MHFLTALTACQIIANNAFDGYLVAEKPEGPRIVAEDDSILTHGQYFFVVPDRPQYPIVPSFQEWQFPKTLPQAWQEAAQVTLDGDAPVSSDTRGEQRCAVIGRFIVEVAHLSPKEEETWFINNTMTVYDSHSASSPSDCPSNQILLDCSLHRAMDQRLWAFAPRRKRFAVQTICLPESYTHNMQSEFVHDYHGRHLHATGMLRTEPEYLFARFAWAVLYLVKSFVLMGRKKTSLARYRVWDDGVARVKEQGMEAKEVDMLYGGGGRGVPVPASAVVHPLSRVGNSWTMAVRVFGMGHVVIPLVGFPRVRSEAARGRAKKMMSDVENGGAMMLARVPLRRRR